MLPQMPFRVASHIERQGGNKAATLKSAPNNLCRHGQFLHNSWRMPPAVGIKRRSVHRPGFLAPIGVHSRALELRNARPPAADRPHIKEMSVCLELAALSRKRSKRPELHVISCPGVKEAS